MKFIGVLKRYFTGFTTLATILVGFASSAFGQVTITGTDGIRSASAQFSISGNNLFIDLTNTSGYDAHVPTDMLTGVFFEFSEPGFSFVKDSSSSVTLGTGATVINGGTTDPGNVVGGEYAFQGSSNFYETYDYGISSSGLGLFGPGDRFSGNNLDGPENVGGLQYAITTATDNGGNNGGASVPLIKNSVRIKLTAVTPIGQSLNLDSIGKVRFQYGTNLVEPSFSAEPITGIPEPGTLGLLAVGLSAGAAILIRRRIAG